MKMLEKKSRMQKITMVSHIDIADIRTKDSDTPWRLEPQQPSEELKPGYVFQTWTFNNSELPGRGKTYRKIREGL